jgi:hypothetical protein
VAPIKSDVQNIVAILEDFGEVTGLCTDSLKSSIVPIWCVNIDLDEVLEGIPAARASFLLRYLGLPLLVWSLRRRDFQHLEDKCAGKLLTWNAKLINMASRDSRVRSVLASQDIYHLTPLTIPSGTLKYINKLERAFIWAAKESTSEAKCKVNWELVCRRRCMEALGSYTWISLPWLALRLWLAWLEWKSNDKIWVGSNNPCTDKGMEIFCAATTITLGNGCKISFLYAPWVEGKIDGFVA